MDRVQDHCNIDRGMQLSHAFTNFRPRMSSLRTNGPEHGLSGPFAAEAMRPTLTLEP